MRDSISIFFLLILFQLWNSENEDHQMIKNYKMPNIKKERN